MWLRSAGAAQMQTHVSMSSTIKCPPISTVGSIDSILRPLSPLPCIIQKPSGLVKSKGVKLLSKPQSRETVPLPAEDWSCLLSGNLSRQQSESCEHHLGTHTLSHTHTHTRRSSYLSASLPSTWMFALLRGALLQWVSVYTEK